MASGCGGVGVMDGTAEGTVVGVRKAVGVMSWAVLERGVLVDTLGAGGAAAWNTKKQIRKTLKPISNRNINFI
jgi:hypothetical protein